MTPKKHGTNTGIPGLSFSWKRAVGLSRFKNRLGREIGIPTTRSGRQRKWGAKMGACSLPFFFFIFITACAWHIK